MTLRRPEHLVAEYQEIGKYVRTYDLVSVAAGAGAAAFVAASFVLYFNAASVLGRVGVAAASAAFMWIWTALAFKYNAMQGLRLARARELERLLGMAHHARIAEARAAVKFERKPLALAKDLVARRDFDAVGRIALKLRLGPIILALAVGLTSVWVFLILTEFTVLNVKWVARGFVGIFSFVFGALKAVILFFWHVVVAAFKGAFRK